MLQPSDLPGVSMTAEQIYKAYVGGLDIPTLARATGYGYAAIDQIINGVKHNHETALRVNRATSSLQGYGRASLDLAVLKSGVSAASQVQGVDRVAQATQQLQQQAQQFQIPAQMAVSLAQSVAGKADRSDVTLNDLIGALFQLDLIKSIAWLPKESEFPLKANYTQAVYYAIRKPAGVLLPLVKDNKIDPADAAAALKSPEAESVSRIHESWNYNTSIAFFKAALRGSTRTALRAYGRKIAESVEAQEKAELATARGYTDLSRQYRELDDQKRSTASRVRTEAITDAALQGVNVGQLNALFDLTAATSALGAAAAFRPSFTADEEENAKTAQMAAVIGEATGADSTGGSATTEDIVNNTESTTSGFTLPDFIVGEKGLTTGAKAGLVIATLGLAYFLFGRGR